MAKRRNVRSRRNENQATNEGKGHEAQEATGSPPESHVVPRVLIETVSSVEIVAEGLLQLTRNLVVSAVSATADIGVVALSATATGARGVVSVTSRMVGDIAGAAQTGLRAALTSVQGSKPRAARAPPRHPLARVASHERQTADERPAPSRQARPARRRRGAQQPSAVVAA